ncbi:LysR family transcriptional regulator [Brevibacterium album]|uniref:LysR family transcriptional regulator n=1 Tax=Brevibacterium album TaxID=417948 RepID=UPI000405FAFA|nr:LysR family transcriptional regulator [Brevibacterium album]
MERRQAEHFLAVCETGTFSAAAQRLGVSQPALSQSVRSLEEELGAMLFDRGPAGAVLTSSGRRLAPVAADILRGFEAAAHAVRSSSRRMTGTLHLMCPASLVLEPLLPVLAEFRRRHPAVHLEIGDPRTEAEVIESVASGRADCGFASGSPHAPGLVAEVCAAQAVVAVLPPDTRPADRRIATLLSHGLVCAPHGRTIRRLLEDVVGHAAVARAITAETEHSATLAPLVRQGAGVAFLPAGEAAPLKEAGLRIVEPEPSLQRTVALLHRPASTAPELAAFRTVVRETGEGRL